MVQLNLFTSDYLWALGLITLAAILDVCQALGYSYRLKSDIRKDVRFISRLAFWIGLGIFITANLAICETADFWYIFYARLAMMTIAALLSHMIIKIVHFGYVLHFRWHIF